MAAVEAFLHSFTLVGLFGLLVVLLVYFLSSLASKNQKQGPPGPKPLPLLGNLLQLDTVRPDETLVEFSKKYGSVFSVYVGTKRVVVLAGYKTVKQALVNYAEAFGERDTPLVIQDADMHHGITWGNGDSWKEMRRFALTNLRDFGMGKRACEDKIIEECQHLLQEVRNFRGEAFDSAQLLHCAVSNIISSMVYGSRFEYEDPDFKEILNRTARSIHLSGTPAVQLYNLLPSIGKMLVSVRKEVIDIYAANKRHHTNLLQKLKETLKPPTCRGIADVFMVQQQKLQESGLMNGHYSNANLLVTIMNLFAAGTDTTATTLRWGLLLMAKYPKIQDQVQEELNRVKGGHQVLVEDRPNLPFTNAVVHEIQRFANIAPLALFHRTTKDVTFQGHFIEKGTTVIPFLTTVLHDESEWEKPNDFFPAHFLDEDGKFLKRDAFMPFSAGTRMCPGEGLTRMELFIFFSTLLQHFRFSPPPGVLEEELDLTPLFGTTLCPQPHKLCAVSLM